MELDARKGIRDENVNSHREYSVADANRAWKRREPVIVKSVYEHTRKGSLLIGTNAAEIIEFEVLQGVRVLHKAPFDSEINHIVANPDGQSFLAIDQSGWVSVWGTLQRKQLLYGKLHQGSNAFSYMRTKSFE